MVSYGGRWRWRQMTEKERLSDEASGEMGKINFWGKKVWERMVTCPSAERVQASLHWPWRSRTLRRHETEELSTQPRQDRQTDRKKGLMELSEEPGRDRRTGWMLWQTEIEEVEVQSDLTDRQTAGSDEKMMLLSMSIFELICKTVHCTRCLRYRIKG